jgi:hypothetical protein
MNSCAHDRCPVITDIGSSPLFTNSQFIMPALYDSHFSIATRLKLKTKSYGRDGERHLVVSKKPDMWQTLEQLLRNGGSTERYDLVKPTGPASQHHAW